MHSREYMDFIPRVMRLAPPADALRRLIEQTHTRRTGKQVAYDRAFWRPPLHPRAAYELEADQIRNLLGLRPLVSITDHDDLEACAELHAIDIDVPYSSEWTVPYKDTVFHIGVHNLPPEQARSLAAEMEHCRANPTPQYFRPVLAALDALPGVLLVLNHPFCNEERVDRPRHIRLLLEFLATYGQWLHALELNGLQPTGDNRETIKLAAEKGFPVISGGDRHCREANANVNLTNAASFDEFVDEVRREAFSLVLFLPQYREPIAARYIEFIWHAVQPYPELPGRERWVDRVFYDSVDGEVLPLSVQWPSGGPAPIRWFLSAVEFLATPHMRATLRRALGEQNEIGA
ncbi:MAG TPA: hypothetical protein VG096_21845 [Bryobacteraceae bacterium]|jgi:hypothetical protein|nr:hypothetical protein [Bryobacteraceae bacterium]